VDEVEDAEINLLDKYLKSVVNRPMLEDEIGLPSTQKSIHSHWIIEDYRFTKLTLTKENEATTVQGSWHR